MIYATFTNDTTNIAGSLTLEYITNPSVGDVTRLVGSCIKEERPLRIIVDGNTVVIGPDVLRKTVIRLEQKGEYPNE
jgi:hypothetical protein